MAWEKGKEGSRVAGDIAFEETREGYAGVLTRMGPFVLAATPLLS